MLVDVVSYTMKMCDTRLFVVDLKSLTHISIVLYVCELT